MYRGSLACWAGVQGPGQVSSSAGLVLWLLWVLPAGFSFAGPPHDAYYILDAHWHALDERIYIFYLLPLLDAWMYFFLYWPPLPAG